MNHFEDDETPERLRDAVGIDERQFRAEAMMRKAVRLHEDGGSDDGLQLLDEVVLQNRSDTDPRLRETT